jgi:hypothetical protein
VIPHRGGGLAASLPLYPRMTLIWSLWRLGLPLRKEEVKPGQDTIRNDHRDEEKRHNGRGDRPTDLGGLAI